MPGGELHRRGLAGDHGARRTQSRDDRRVALVAPRRVEHQALRGGRRVVGGDDVLDAERDALQRTPIDAVGEVRIGLARLVQRRRVHAVKVDPELRIQTVGALEHRPRQLHAASARRRAAPPPRR